MIKKNSVLWYRVSIFVYKLDFLSIVIWHAVEILFSVTLSTSFSSPIEALISPSIRSPFSFSPPFGLTFSPPLGLPFSPPISITITWSPISDSLTTPWGWRIITWFWRSSTSWGRRPITNHDRPVPISFWYRWSLVPPAWPWTAAQEKRHMYVYTDESCEHLQVSPAKLLRTESDERGGQNFWRTDICKMRHWWCWQNTCFVHFTTCSVLDG